MQDAICNQIVQQVCHVTANEEENGTFSQFPLGVPLGQVPQSSGNKSRLTKAKEESSCQEARFAANKSLESCYKTPGQ
jgi:hypothetical protein